MRLFIFGLGYSASAFLDRVRAETTWIGATTRSRDKAQAMNADGIEPFLFDNGKLADGMAKALRQATHILVSIAPDSDGSGHAADPVLRHCKDSLAAATPSWIGYLSTVGVYGDHGGAWVDEETSCKPVSQRSKRRVAAESAWLDFAHETDTHLGIFRLSGIYGPGRNAFVNLEAGKARRLVKPDQVFNRIHVDDIAGVLAASLARPLTRIYNVTDDEPAPPQDVVEYAARLIGLACPPELDFATADISPMARSFYGENKRVSNARVKGELGYIFRHPTYREALNAMISSGWR